MQTALVSQILPETNYSRYLANALGNCLVYTDKDQKNLDTELKERVRLCWTKNGFKYPFEILKQARKDKVGLIHLQHEFNMFGLRVLNAAIFPLLPLLLRIFGFKVVTTIHAVVKPSQVTLEFLDIFGWPAKRCYLLPIKIFLHLLYSSTCLFSNKIVVHSEILKKILTDDYHVKEKKTAVVPIGIPKTPDKIGLFAAEGRKLKAEGFLLYFGYFHKRKGLRELILAFEKISQKHPKLTLVLAGGTLQKSYEDEIKNLVKQCNFEKKVIFTGFAGLPQLNWLLEHCLAVVLPLTYSVAGSGPLAEVAARHKPLITTEVGVNAGELKNGKNALLVPPQDIAALTKAILRVVESQSLREKLSNGMKNLQKERAWPKIATQTKNVYGSVWFVGATLVVARPRGQP